MTKLPKAIQALLDDINNDPVIEKYRYKYTWTSGSSTEVYPIEVGPRDICIQLDTARVLKASRKAAFNMRHYKILEACMNHIADKHKDILSYCYLTAHDGSCPPCMEFKYRDDIDLRKICNE